MMAGMPIDMFIEPEPDPRTAGPVSSSSLSLLGLVRHLAEVERSWFRRVMAGQDAPPRFYSAQDRDGDFDNVRPDLALVAGAWQAWREEVAFADQFVAAAPGLDLLAQRLTAGGRGPVSLRLGVKHMVGAC